MDVALWIAAGLLALVALVSGSSKAFVPKEKLSAVHGGEWTDDAGVGFVKTLGLIEILAAVGLILPGLLGVATFMVPVTAVCWIVLMVLAIITHLRYEGGVKFALLNVTYLAIATFIAWGRIVAEPFTA
ncbi:DoxX family protein [Agromyces sp. H66]|uniref:DoxX family protein n=1 Tax=Agromyces sp. H66 TaxID=2529859 RepID=UPI0010AA1091|nr:DoxX family protein [Agromyces sp. H66]